MQPLNSTSSDTAQQAARSFHSRSGVVVLTLTVLAATLLMACHSAEQKTSSTEESTPEAATASPSAGKTGRSAPATPDREAPAPPFASAHGRTAPTSNAGPSGPTDLDTSALDARIARAEAKAKIKGATAADKQAAAAAYLERANMYYSAGQPRLYKFALGDFRRVLRYEPDNAEAREKLEMIVSIYQSMGRPVPDNGREP